jgi:uncharacterized phage protein gp47/JayE
MALTIEELKTSLLESYNRLVPELDLSEGSTERDIFIEAPAAGALSPLLGQLNVVEQIQRIYKNADSIPNILIDEWGQDNFKISRVPATPAFGSVIFYSYAFTNPILIPENTRVQTSDSNPIIYVTQTSSLYSPLDAPIFYNATRSRYEFIVPVKSLNSGDGTGTGVGSVNIIVTPIDGIDGVTNDFPINSGLPEETNSSYLARIAQLYQGRTTETNLGLNSFFSNFFSDFKIVKFGDPGYLRNKYPGGIDVYYPVEREMTVVETFNITETDFTGSFIFKYQPVISIVSVVGDVSGELPQNLYTLLKDNGLLKESTRSTDGIKINPPGINDNTITVSYIYNDFLNYVDSALSSEDFRKPGGDYLIRRSNKVTVNLTVPVRFESGAVKSTTTNNIISTLSNFINNTLQGSIIRKGDLVNVAEVPGVDIVNYSTFDISLSGGGQIDEQGDIVLGGFEYAEIGTVTVITF